MGRKLDFLNMDTLSVLLPVVMAVIPHFKNSGSRREKDRVKARERAYKGKEIEPEEEPSTVDTLMKLIPTLTAALPALKAAVTGADDTMAQQAIERLQTALTGTREHPEEVSSRVLEILPELLRVLSELSKTNPEAKNTNLDQVAEALTEVIASEQQAAANENNQG